jgi:8-oxo-dGTP pyrophosphatase MutT (NUDIX family)
LDPADRVLLLLAGQPEDDHTWWLAPGGGLDSGETFEAAALREAQEETGLEVELGPCVWTRHHVFEWKGRRVNQYERFFVGRCTSNLIAPPRQDSYVRGHKWWTLKEVMASPDDFAPAKLGELLPDIIRGAYPALPIDAGV